MERLIAPPAQAPVIFPSYVELWAQTSPPPAVDPWPPLFLHGIGSDRPAEVQIVFRADIDDADLLEERRDALIRLLETAPPSSLEVLTLPLGAARNWLAGATSADVGDVVGADGGVEEQIAPSARASAFRWAGGESAPVKAGRIRPGDTLVVPAARGGCDRWGWAPGDERWVADLTTEAMLRHRNRLVWRLTPMALRTAADPEEEVRFDAMAELLGRAELAPQDLLAAIPETPGFPERWRRTAAFLDDESRSIALELVRLDETDPARGAWLVSRRRLSPKMAKELALLLVEGDVTSNDENIAQEAATEDDSGSFGEATAALLEDHLYAVAAQVADQAQRAGIAPELAELVELAARYHDAGKAELRFQAWLAGTDELGVMATAPRAKSGHVRPPSWDRRLREVAGWPTGARHEAWSVRLAEDAPAVRHLPADDADLVLHLIGAHHGHGRPFFPAVDDAGDLDVVIEFDGEQLRASGDHGLARLDAGTCERFAVLNARFGPWQLAWLEAILRLADHRVSREGR